MFGTKEEDCVQSPPTSTKHQMRDYHLEERSMTKEHWSYFGGSRWKNIITLNICHSFANLFKYLVLLYCSPNRDVNTLKHQSQDF